MMAKIKDSIWEERLESLKSYISSSFQPEDDFLVSLGAGKTARIRSWFPGTRDLVRRQLVWAIVARTDVPVNATIWFWKEPSPADFSERILHVDPEDPADKRWTELYYYHEPLEALPCGTVDATGEWGIHLCYRNDYFYGLSDDLRPGERLAHWQRFFFEAFFRILNTPTSSLVHGASVGLDGKGVLICARGGGGKSTLSVLAMIRGFDFVADDYTVLSLSGGCLQASPLYSYVNLAPEVYERLFDDLDRARFLGIGSWKGKYLVDISRYTERLSQQLPIRAAIFPEIDTNATHPRVAACSHQEKGRTIVQIAHSTLSQMYKGGFRQDQRDTDFLRKTISMLSGLDFYRITLSPDLEANVDCLRELIKNYK